MPHWQSSAAKRERVGWHARHAVGQNHTRHVLRQVRAPTDDLHRAHTTSHSLFAVPSQAAGGGLQAMAALKNGSSRTLVDAAALLQAYMTAEEEATSAVQSTMRNLWRPHSPSRRDSPTPTATDSPTKMPSSAGPLGLIVVPHRRPRETSFATPPLPSSPPPLAPVPPPAARPSPSPPPPAAQSPAALASGWQAALLTPPDALLATHVSSIDAATPDQIAIEAGPGETVGAAGHERLLATFVELTGDGETEPMATATSHDLLLATVVESPRDGFLETFVPVDEPSTGPLGGRDAYATADGSGLAGGETGLEIGRGPANATTGGRTDALGPVAMATLQRSRHELASLVRASASERHAHEARREEVDLNASRLLELETELNETQRHITAGEEQLAAIRAIQHSRFQSTRRRGAQSGRRSRSDHRSLGGGGGSAIGAAAAPPGVGARNAAAAADAPFIERIERTPTQVPRVTGSASLEAPPTSEGSTAVEPHASEGLTPSDGDAHQPSDEQRRHEIDAHLEHALQTSMVEREHAMRRAAALERAADLERRLLASAAAYERAAAAERRRRGLPPPPVDQAPPVLPRLPAITAPQPPAHSPNGTPPLLLPGAEAGVTVDATDDVSRDRLTRERISLAPRQRAEPRRGDRRGDRHSAIAAAAADAALTRAQARERRVPSAPTDQQGLEPPDALARLRPTRQPVATTAPPSAAPPSMPPRLLTRARRQDLAQRRQRIALQRALILAANTQQPSAFSAPPSPLQETASSAQPPTNTTGSAATAATAATAAPATPAATVATAVPAATVATVATPTDRAPARARRAVALAGRAHRAVVAQPPPPQPPPQPAAAAAGPARKVLPASAAEMHEATSRWAVCFEVEEDLSAQLDGDLECIICLGDMQPHEDLVRLPCSEAAKAQCADRGRSEPHGTVLGVRAVRHASCALSCPCPYGYTLFHTPPPLCAHAYCV